MNVSLPAELTAFIDKKVKAGLYQDASDVMRDALRQFEQRDRAADGVASLGNLSSISDLHGADIEALVFLVLMQAVKDADQDLKMIMAEIKAMTAAKDNLRELISKVNKDVAANAGQKDKQPPLNFSTGMGSEEAYHHAQMPVADPESEHGLKFVPTNLYNDHLDDVAQLRCVQDDLKGQLDSMGEMSELTSLLLQMAMDRRSKVISTLSNILKKISTTQETLVQNLK
jgi:putative addiction module CopG family antidote